MDPLSAMIGGMFSLGGSLFNTSSAQSINSANLAQSMYMANNAVSMRVADAKRAGINPLAALGVSTPGFVGATPTDPGAGLEQVGASIAKVDPYIGHHLKMQDIAERKAETDVQLAAANVTEQNFRNQVARHTLNVMASDPSLLPAGVSERSSHGGLVGQAMGLTELIEALISGRGRSNPVPAAPPAGSYNTP